MQTIPLLTERGMRSAIVCKVIDKMSLDKPENVPVPDKRVAINVRKHGSRWPGYLAGAPLELQGRTCLQLVRFGS
jgi:hypothetical protein